MKCRLCNTNFEPSEEEYAYAREAGSPEKNEGRSYVESFLPKFCCYECFKHYQHFKSHGNKERLRKHKEQNRWLYHIGDKEPRAGSPDARREEELYRKKMEESCEKRPPKVGHTGFADGSQINPPILPSEVFLGTAKNRVCDEVSIHLGGDDGDKFNFEGE